MKKLIVLLVLIGFLVGAFSAIVDVCEELSLEMSGEFVNSDPGNDLSILTPCGEGGTGGPAFPG